MRIACIFRRNKTDFLAFNFFFQNLEKENNNKFTIKKYLVLIFQTNHIHPHPHNNEHNFIFYMRKNRGFFQNNFSFYNNNIHTFCEMNEK